MDGPRLIHSISARNILSFGVDGISLELLPLNVFVGPNGVGKSNFIEILRLAKGMATANLTTTLSAAGGSAEWAWKGGSSGPCKIAITMDLFHDFDPNTYVATHEIEFWASRFGASVSREEIIESSGNDEELSYNYLFSQQPTIWRTSWIKDSDGNRIPVKTDEKVDNLDRDRSILSQRNDPSAFPVLTQVSKKYQDFHFYTDIGVGRKSAARLPQDESGPHQYLSEDGSNLALVINHLQLRAGFLGSITEYLRKFYAPVERILTHVNSGYVQTYLEQSHPNYTVPANRISDGTLRFLCLLVILCHPFPPPLVCIEEPELGMHPDIIPVIAELLIAASKRMQLIVTTHSDILLSALYEVPESIIICSQSQSGTLMKRPDPEELALWTKDLSLGDAWLKGAFGGTRW